MGFTLLALVCQCGLGVCVAMMFPSKTTELSAWQQVTIILTFAGLICQVFALSVSK